ncbi:MAG: PEP-CTERM sorting domain-containing protein [Colwellia sp.]|nr:PEP-CTERM sorting domain-containing protein [Colwellia sp.]
MIKFFIKVNIVLCFLISSFAQATLIPLDIKELSEDSYIEYNHNGVIYDIAWASPVNTQKYYDANINILYEPSIRTGWEFANNEQLALLKTLADAGELIKTFTSDADQSFIHAFRYWNDFFTAPDVGDNANQDFASQWVWSFPKDISGDDIPTDDSIDEAGLIIGTTGSTFDTFYFRVQNNGATPVPEPSTLIIFALGLIALVSKKQLFS